MMAAAQSSLTRSRRIGVIGPSQPVATAQSKFTRSSTIGSSGPYPLGVTAQPTLTMALAKHRAFGAWADEGAGPSLTRSSRRNRVAEPDASQQE